MPITEKKIEMPSNLDRFRKDLEQLINRGQLLHTSMLRQLHSKEVDRQITEKIGKDKLKEYLAILPNFNIDYEVWYSEALVLLRQLLPDRVQHFVSFYEKPKGRKDISYGNYVLQDFLQGLRVSRGGVTVVDLNAAIPQFNQQLAIVQAAKQRFESSLFEIRQLVQADLFDEEIVSARELQKAKFYRAAGVLAGVVLEKHLHQVCSDHGVKIAKKGPGLNDLGEALRTNGVIDVPQWRHLSFLADIRNICAHNKKAEPTGQQVSDLLNGVEKTLKIIL